ncbi:MAG: hypothetical protein H7843_10455 [Nitrospirota bacterium]
MLRHLLWSWLYGKIVPTTLTGKEIIISVLVSIVLLALYFVFKRMFFYTINDNIHNARYGAAILAVALSLSWLIASLELFGFRSTVVAVALLLLALLIDIVYLYLTKDR